MKHLITGFILLLLMLTPITFAQDTSNDSEAEPEATETMDMDSENAEDMDDMEMENDMMSNGDFTVNLPEVDPLMSLAFIRFANFAPDIGNVDYYFAGDDTPVIEDMAYGEYSDVIVVNSGNLTIISRPAGSGSDGEQLSAQDWNFSGGTTWFFSGIGLQSEVAYFLEPISIIRNNYGEQGRVRVINLVTDKQSLSVRHSTCKWHWMGRAR